MELDYLSLTYAGFVALGGLIGYLKAGSKVSLLSGTIFGSVLALGAYNVSKDPHNSNVLLVTNTVLAVVMGSRFYRSKKVMPAGIITLISTLMILRFSFRALI